MLSYVRRNGLFIALLVIAAICLFMNIGSRSVQEWDESRNGVNAWEMYYNHDYINLYYNGALDTWNAKPPLLIWLILISYKIFGFNEVALRFPAALACLVFLIVFYEMVKRFYGRSVAVIAAAIMVSCRAVVGDHMGLTGDFDMLLCLWLLCAAYSFLLYAEDGKNRQLLYCALFTGLAFYSKGTPALLYIPGMLLYLVLKGAAKQFFLSKWFWRAAGVFFLLMGSWLLLVYCYGAKLTNSFYGSDNAIATMFIHDTWRRLFSSDFSDEYQDINYGLFFITLDLRMNLWNYLFYGSVLTGIIILAKNKRMSFLDKIKAYPLLLFSACIIIPYFLLITFARFKHNWYMAPSFCFITAITAVGIGYWCGKVQWLKVAIAVLVVFCLGRQFMQIYQYPTAKHDWFVENRQLLQQDTLTVTVRPTQDIYFYLLVGGAKMRTAGSLQQSIDQGDKLIFSVPYNDINGYVEHKTPVNFSVYQRQE